MFILPPFYLAELFRNKQFFMTILFCLLIRRAPPLSFDPCINEQFYKSPFELDELKNYKF